MSRNLPWQHQGTLKEWKMAKLPHTWSPENIYGKRYPIFSYAETRQTQFFNRVLEYYENCGFNRKEAFSIISRKLLKKNSPGFIEYFAEGKIALEFWMYDEIRKLANMDEYWKTEKEGDKRYSYTFEGSKLVLECSFPKFYVVLNLDDWTDYEADFSQAKTLRDIVNGKDTIEQMLSRTYREIYNIVSWYFLTVARKKQLPFNKKIFRSAFDLKFHNNEIRIRNESKKHL